MIVRITTRKLDAGRQELAAVYGYLTTKLMKEARAKLLDSMQYHAATNPHIWRPS